MLRLCLVALAAILTASGCAGGRRPVQRDRGWLLEVLVMVQGTAGSGSGTARQRNGRQRHGTAGSGTARATAEPPAPSPTGTGGTGPTVTPPKQALTRRRRAPATRPGRASCGG